jgi:hypothetical protein
MRPAMELTPLYRRRDVEGVGDVCAEALSPSSATWQTAVGQVAQFIEILQSGLSPTDVRLENGMHPNDLSIAVWIRVGDRHLLLGADLENGAHGSGRGWQAVIDLDADREAGAHTLAEIVKVPHHGSKNANAPMRWGELMTASPGAVVAPWILGGRLLPQADDLETLADRCRFVWVAAEVPIAPTFNAQRPNERATPVRSAGFVRLRSVAVGASAWEVHLGGSAFTFA